MEKIKQDNVFKEDTSAIIEQLIAFMAENKLKMLNTLREIVAYDVHVTI